MPYIVIAALVVINFGIYTLTTKATKVSTKVLKGKTVISNLLVQPLLLRQKKGKEKVTGKDNPDPGRMLPL
jgi:hypothetical protein